MTKRLISLFLTLVLLAVIPLSGRYRYNPYTTKLDYYEAAGDVDLGDIGDITLTGLATGNILYYNGTAWVNLATGANTNVLTLAGGIPSWAAPGAPAAHAPTHLAAGADPVDHDQLLNYLAAQHLTLPNTLVAVLTDHNAAAHVALGFLALPSTIAAVLTDHNLAAHTALGLYDAPGDVDHNLTTNYAANQHVVLPATIATVLTDHNLATHTALGLFDQSSDVDHNATTNYFIYNHVGEDHIVDHNIWIGWLAGEDLAVGGQYNTLIGEEAGKNITTADNHVVLGYQAAFFNQTGQHNVVIGSEAGYGVTGNSYTDNVIIGYKAGFGITEGVNNVFVGFESGYEITEGFHNTAVGYQAMYKAGAAEENTAFGAQAGYHLGDGSTSNVYVGERAGYGVVGNDNSDNVGVGKTVLYHITTGSENVSVGSGSLNSLTDGAYNVSIGTASGGASTTADYNTIVGTRASFHNITGEFNVIVGAHAGFGVINQSYSSNVIIGYQAAEDITTGSLNVIIGYMAGEGWIDTEANTFVIANTDTITPLLHGLFTIGDLISASLTHNSDHKVTGYNRYDTVYWNDCFDHGTVASKYQFDWDITSLNTQGNGANTVDTTPSEITLTTDNNAIGDNEGTRTEFAVIQRARQNRTEWSLDLKQTANTQFYMGWNTSGTNAMVAAADEYVIVFFDVSDNANWQIKVGDGATEDVFTSAVAGAVAHIIHEVWVETDGTVHWRVNGTELDITGSVDNLMTANDHYLIVGQAQSITGAAVIVVEIDYVENEKTKAH